VAYAILDPAAPDAYPITALTWLLVPFAPKDQARPVLVDFLTWTLQRFPRTEPRIGDPSVNPGTSPAMPGETIAVFGTGFTPSVGGTEDISLTALTPLPLVTIGGTAAKVVFAGLTSPGLFQVNIVVPQVGPGVYPIMVTWGGVTSPVGVQIPVSQ
jgi:uncharacterized protein (TIGR03437 family)